MTPRPKSERFKTTSSALVVRWAAGEPHPMVISIKQDDVLTHLRLPDVTLHIEDVDVANVYFDGISQPYVVLFAREQLLQRYNLPMAPNPVLSAATRRNVMGNALLAYRTRRSVVENTKEPTLWSVVRKLHCEYTAMLLARAPPHVPEPMWLCDVALEVAPPAPLDIPLFSACFRRHDTVSSSNETATTCPPAVLVRHNGTLYLYNPDHLNEHHIELLAWLSASRMSSEFAQMLFESVFTSYSANGACITVPLSVPQKTPPVCSLRVNEHCFSFVAIPALVFFL
jgi:hypothetical protein